MKRFSILFLLALCMAATAIPLSARRTPAMLLAEESLSNATAQRVLGLAAPVVGQSAASLYSQYQLGTVTITDLGPIKDGHRYGVRISSSELFVVIEDLIAT